MGFPNVDPNAVREQQQLGRMRALKQAKNASAVSVKKTLMIIVPIFIAALILVLFFSGAFDRGYTIRWNDRLYRVSDDLNEDLVYELPDGYTLAGNLSFADNPKKAGENLAFVFFMNLAFNIIVIAGGLATNSMAILADCIHDLSDTISIAFA